MAETDTTQGDIDLSDIAAEMGIPLTPETTTEHGKETAAGSDDLSDSQDDEALTDESDNASTLDAEESESDAESKTADEADEESDDEETEAEEEERPAHKGVEKRIAKLTAKAKEAQEALAARETTIAELEQKLAAATNVTLAPTPDSPLANIETPEALAEQIQLARRIEAWAEDHADGADVKTPDGGTRFMDADEVKHRLRAARNILRAAPEREQWLAQRPAVIEEAKAFYPTLLKAGTPEHQMMTQLLKQVPELKRHPGLELLVGDMIEGYRVRLERAKAQQRAAASSGKKSEKAQNDGKQPASEKLPRTPTTSRAAKLPQDKARAEAARTRVQRGDTSRDAMTDFIENVILG